MTCIIVKPIWVNDVSGKESFMYDEIGTPVFYMISNILKKHLGEDNIWVYLNYDNPELFTICYINCATGGFISIDDFISIADDKLKEHIEIIKNIYELHTLIPIHEEHMPSAHIKFEIIVVSVDADANEKK